MMLAGLTMTTAKSTDEAQPIRLAVAGVDLKGKAGWNKEKLRPCVPREDRTSAKRSSQALAAEWGDCPAAPSRLAIEEHTTNASSHADADAPCSSVVPTTFDA